jgi:hypothetical protein
MTKHSAALLACIVLAATADAHEPYTPTHLTDYARVCVERAENSGLVNIVPVTIIVSAAKLTLLGGQAGCLYLAGGPQTIGVSFPYPYSGARSPQVWTTHPQHFAMRPGTTTRFELDETANQRVNDPQWAQSGWHAMWQLKQR